MEVNGLVREESAQTKALWCAARARYPVAKLYILEAMFSRPPGTVAKAAVAEFRNPPDTVEWLELGPIKLSWPPPMKA